MKKLIALGLIVGIVMGIANMSFAEVEKKSPSTALLWSLLITGGGQIYNGETTKGLLMMGGQIILVSTMFKKETTRDDYDWGSIETTETKIQTPQLIAALGLGIWSCVDAYKGANRFNKGLGISLLFDKEKTRLAYKCSF